MSQPDPIKDTTATPSSPGTGHPPVSKPEPTASNQVPPQAVAQALPIFEAPHALSHLSTKFEAVDFAVRGVHLEATVTPDQVVRSAEELDAEGFALDTITGVDWLASKQMEVVYDYFHPTKPLRVAVKARIPRENPEIPTIQAVFPGANWHEREAHDFFGIEFAGHPDLSPFLLPEDAEYHPLLKDFKA